MPVVCPWCNLNWLNKVPLNTPHIRIRRLHTTWHVVFTEISQGTSMASYIWSCLNNFLMSYGVSYQDLVEACSEAKYDFMKWLECQISWDAVLNSLGRYLGLSLPHIPRPDILRLNYIVNWSKSMDLGPLLCPKCNKPVDHLVIHKP